ncbi:MAG: hypothetical protein DDT31_01613 [Syntrophomonadaceae bacterium]|nr:hypothetical protein [Bacillota bacterium]
MYTTKKEWLGMIRGEYLHNFIKSGGAAVKFCVPVEEIDHKQFLTLLRTSSEEENYLFTSVDAVSTKIHMIDKLFHEVARQIDWDDLSQAFIRKIFSQNGYQLPKQHEEFNLQNIAEINAREEKFLRNELYSCLEKEIFCDFEMSQEFRIAMIRLCLNQLDTAKPSAFMSNAVKEWLRGELRLISTLKNALIFQKIARHNARHMLFSLTHWLRVNGKSGLVLVLDITRYLISTRSKNPDDGFFYSAPAVLDAYELLRQFIDGTDEMEGLLIIVLASKDFLNDDKRGLRSYDALKLRIWDEVRDRQRQNPLASLVRLSSRGAD